MKIGILTEYFRNANFGGNFQSYALCKFITKTTGNSCQQISFDKKIFNMFKYKLLSFYKLLLLSFYFIINREKFKRLKKEFLLQKKHDKYKFKLYKRVWDFNLKIPHTNKHFYDNSNFFKLNKVFDCFIAGSDQIWNLNWLHDIYFLSFAGSNKYKFSYAASIGMESLTEDQKKFFFEKLKHFDSISVREEKARELLQPLTDKKVVVTLDPTLLLDRSDWEDILVEKKIPEKYLFCYFLGHSVSQRKLAENYAKKHNLKIVCLPFLAENTDYDFQFGDYRLSDITPNQLLSLIKNSEFVMTDSFHACVFSIIFQKQFIVFNRNSETKMSSRIDTLTNLFDMQERFCNSNEKESIDYIDSLNYINYNQDFIKYKEAKKISIDFLNDNLKKAEIMINNNKNYCK